MSICMNRVNAVIQGRFIPDENNCISVNNIIIKIDPKEPIWKQIKRQQPAEYIKLVDSIFDELHPY